MEQTKQPIQTTKVTVETLRLLRIVSALTGEKHYQVLERLIREEYAKVSSAEQLRRS